MNIKWLRIALLAGVALDCITPGGGFIQAHAQAGNAPALGDTFTYQSQDAPPQDTMIVDQLGRQRMSVNNDGSINTRAVNLPVPISFQKNGCTAVSNRALITLVPPAGQYVYFLGMSMDVWENATGSSLTTQLVTVSNLLSGGALNSAIAAWTYAVPGTANTTYNVVRETYAFPGLRSNYAGASVALQGPAADSNTGQCLRAAYYFAP